jgi:transposase
LQEVKLANLAVIGTLTQQIDKLERCLHERVRLREEFGLLKSAPGIGETLATTIMLEAGAGGALCSGG